MELTMKAKSFAIPLHFVFASQQKPHAVRRQKRLYCFAVTGESCCSLGIYASVHHSEAIFDITQFVFSHHLARLSGKLL